MVWGKPQCKDKRNQQAGQMEGLLLLTEGENDFITHTQFLKLSQVKPLVRNYTKTFIHLH